MKPHIERRLKNTRARQRLYKNRHLHARELKLDDAEFRLLDLYGAVINWDKVNYPDQFETVKASDQQIGDILVWSNSKVCRVKNKLIKKGLVRKDGNADYKVLRIFDKETPVANMQENIAPVQEKVAPMQENIADLQEIQGKMDSFPLSSSKYQYVIKNKEEYEETKNKVEALSNKIDELHGWLSNDPKLRSMVNEQQRLANAMLMYEIDNDLLPDYLL